MTSLVLTILGPDRVGLVDTLAEVVKRHDANWLESRMSQLAGQFAGLLRVEVPPANSAALLDALQNLDGLQVHAAAIAQPTEAAATDLVHLELVGNDRPGIVAEISHVLAAHGVNVEDLETRCLPAPMTGDPLFEAVADLHIPKSVSADDVATALERLANDLMVELTFS